MRAEVKGEDPAHIDVLMHRRRNAGNQLVGVVGERVADDRLHFLGVPGHDDVGEERQGTGNGGELLDGSAALGADRALLHCPPQAVHGLALVQQVEDLAAEAWVAEIVAQIDGSEQFTQSLTGGVDWITTCGRTESLERLGRGAPAFSNGAGRRRRRSQVREMARRDTVSATIGYSAAGAAIPRAR